MCSLLYGFYIQTFVGTCLNKEILLCFFPPKVFQEWQHWHLFLLTQLCVLRTSSCVFRSCLPFPVLAYGVWLPLRTRAFPFFSSSSSVFVYARANIIMCLSFSSRVLRYKNLLCNTSVIQRITKKFQGIRIICLVKVCLLALKGLLLHPQSREMRHFRQCY